MFRVSLLAVSQIVIFLSSIFKVLMMSVGVLPSINTLVSSAKRTGINISDAVDISLIYKMNNNGPKTDP